MKYAGLYLAPGRSHRVGILRLNEYCMSDTERQSVLPVIALGSVAAPTGDGVHHMHLGVCCKRIRQIYSTSMFSVHNKQSRPPPRRPCKDHFKNPVMGAEHRTPVRRWRSGCMCRDKL
jgi:hypothetical protein